MKLALIVFLLIPNQQESIVKWFRKWSFIIGVNNFMIGKRSEKVNNFGTNTIHDMTLNIWLF